MRIVNQYIYYYCPLTSTHLITLPTILNPMSKITNNTHNYYDKIHHKPLLVMFYIQLHNAIKITYTQQYTRAKFKDANCPPSTCTFSHISIKD